MTFTIEPNIPVPKATRGRLGSKYPFKQMHVGDSFAVDSDTKLATVRSAVGAFCKNHKEYKFAVREHEGVVRVWRVKKEQVE